MSVCLNLFEWAKYWTAKGGIKLHTSLDEQTMLPELINLTEAKISDRRGVDGFRYPKDTIVVDDRGYFDFKLFSQRIEDGNILVTRIKSNTCYESIEELDLPHEEDEHILKYDLLEYVVNDMRTISQKVKNYKKKKDDKQLSFNFG